MNQKELLIPFNSPLRPEDTETQTYGCRANNPDICGNNGLPNIWCFFIFRLHVQEAVSCLEKAVHQVENIRQLNYRLSAYYISACFPANPKS